MPRQPRTNKDRRPGRRVGARRFPAGYLAVIGPLVLALGALAAWLLWPQPGPTDSFNLPGPPQHIHGLAADPHDPDVLWVATHRGLVRHIDGAGWERVGPDNDYMGFAVHPTEPGVLYTSGHPGPGSPTPNPVGFQVSRDGGLTWEGLSLVGQADFHVMAVSPADPQFVYGLNVMDRGLYRSQDGGRTWDNLGMPEFDIFGLAPHPAEPHTLLAATAQGLFLSWDGGQRGTWEPAGTDLESRPVAAVAVDPGDPSVLYAATAGTGIPLVGSRDGGASWEPVGLTLGNEEIALFISIAPTRPDHIYVATSNLNVYRSVDGGATWVALLERGEARQ